MVVGAGFGGVRTAKTLAGRGFDITVIDRHNYHTFSPLLYEVASAGLEPDDIAQPVRAILRGRGGVRFRMAEVQAIDLDARRVHTGEGEVPYDYLVVAAGSATNFFGLASVEATALALKDLREATAVRNRVLRSFERAALTGDLGERRRLMTVVVVGGGPTGVELAGALAELKRHVLPRDYPDIDLSPARVVLLEAADRLLAAMPSRLRRKALEQLERLGVEVRFGAAVRDVDAGGVTLASGERIDAASVIWVAGVRGEPLGEAMGVALGPGRRVRVQPTLQLPGHPEVFVAGDLAYLESPAGQPYPMLAQVAMQQGTLAARNIMRIEAGREPKPFHYRDRGTMTTVGRHLAVAHVFGLQFSGFIAWALWLGVHLVSLIGLRNRALVLVNWAWNYFRYDRANRLVTDSEPGPAHEAPADLASAGRGRPLRD
ncbi:MAG TPA: NAD(P)/FAD-dependent oxidoreductase [Dehalococcoidia bacterium]|nr:NAD(P)/FAD-dependent oxidoreductase [Dehalococcoidia bacterium]